SLLELLRTLRDAGYDTGELPPDSTSLLRRLQRHGVNVPEDRTALARMAESGVRVSGADYRAWLARQPARIQRRLSRGPLADLEHQVRQGLAEAESSLARGLAQRTLGDVRHLIEGSDHPARVRALDLLAQLEEGYRLRFRGEKAEPSIDALTRALERTGIEGLRGWGAPPGEVMVHGDALLIPGLRFGNVFLGPQPPRGWELHEELLHANVSFPPPHQYAAFYYWIRDVWRADAVVHVGRHSTYEFLPGPSVGLAADDFPHWILGDLPSLYLYIVDGVGEGIQAKRRGHAVIVDHLTPSLQVTPLYDDLLQLRQLVESFEAAGPDSPTRSRNVREIRAAVERLELRDELAESMERELRVRGLRFEEADGELLVHEVGHYITELQERFMPFGLHVFGRPWQPNAVERMLMSMAGGEGAPASTWREHLRASPEHERRALLAGLAGRFVPPGVGNDPIRTPEALPTGRNFHALDGSVLPTRVSYELGAELAAQARAERGDEATGREAVVLWASDTVRDEGVMVGFGLRLLGMRPVWNSRGIVKGIERLPLAQAGGRDDAVFVTSGLFRDLYASLMKWLDHAALLALDGASRTIEREHPQLRDALAAALAPLGEARSPGSESLAENHVAAHWVADARRLLSQGAPAGDAGRRASYRVFGNAPGRYGAGINRLAERSGSWRERRELADAYTQRLGFAFGIHGTAEPAIEAFALSLDGVRRTYLGRATHLYGLLDNNDGYDYLGGLSLAVEQQRGNPPESWVVDHADPRRASLRPLPRALLQELRGRHLNPERLRSLMAHGYAGARTLSHGFLENLWGWQVTNPAIVKPWVWSEVKRVYLDDGHGIGLDAFLEDGPNAHVKANLVAIFLVAAERGFWDPGEATLVELAELFHRLVSENGLPGSGHTRPDHPVMDFVRERLPPAERARFDAVRAAAQRAPRTAEAEPASVRELRLRDEPPDGEAESGDPRRGRKAAVLLLAAVAVAGLGYWRGSGRRVQTERSR
ncbi:MAG: cobaltochelatase subunit CobN, partial [Proteobacteria bacterium]|nr:cobaltochelatase subunit CobN [Pseudomonadota bacterium]